MANSNVFCNTPWYEAHIYWDGSLGICCQETDRVYENTQFHRSKFNIKNMRLTEWFNSEPAQQFRLSLLGNRRTAICNRCYHEEGHGGTSRRHRANQKSVIFTRTAFDESFQQSPGYDHFIHSRDNAGHTNTFPIDLHIDLGNYCNLACKMCGPQASTKIASQLVKWHQADAEDFLGVDWTKDPVVWQRFLSDLVAIPKLKNIHLMGGETVLQPKFEEMLDWFIENKKFDVSWSFVTNGTHYRQSIVDKLKRFQRVGIEVSIETVSPRNAYVRQGTNTAEVLNNIRRYQRACSSSNISVTIRPAISLLTIGHYYTLLDFCLVHKLLIKSLLVTEPKFLDAKLLPESIKQLYLNDLDKLKQHLNEVKVGHDYNESDPNLYLQSIKVQLNQLESILKTPTPHNSQTLLEQMVRHCERWDEVYGYDAREIYPELKEIWSEHGYKENIRDSCRSPTQTNLV